MDNLNKINGNKDLYDRVCTWMAAMDEVHAGAPSKDPRDVYQRYINKAANLAEEAFTLFYDIYQTCNDTEDVPF